MARGVRVRRPAWWGGSTHVFWTVVVFVILASLDNAALALIPGMIGVIADDLAVSSGALGLVTGTNILATALTAAIWGYWGDRANRKRMLFYGTLLWSAGLVLSGLAGSYAALFAWQLVTAVGLGSIASVGFSVVSDLVAPRRRGLAMSFWGLSQGIGGWLGLLISSQLGAADWRRPMFVTAAAGGAFALVYLLTYESPRGGKEPALQPLFAAGDAYEYRIEPADLRRLLDRRTNLWLIVQGFTAQFAYGSLVWVPFLYQGKVQAEGYGLETATQVGGLFAAIFQLGGLFSIVAGLLGDRWQRRSPRGRALLSAAGIMGAIPFFLAFFFVPLRGLEVTEGAGTATLLGQVLAEIVTNPWVGSAFLLSLTALAFTSADSPNWFALISDVNLPEHRGTIFGLGNLSNGVGRSIGNALTGVAATALQRAFPPPVNYAVGLALFQIFFVPTGYCYWRASFTAPGDIRSVAQVLEERAGP